MALSKRKNKQNNIIIAQKHKINELILSGAEQSAIFLKKYGETDIWFTRSLAFKVNIEKNLLLQKWKTRVNKHNRSKKRKLTFNIEKT